MIQPDSIVVSGKPKKAKLIIRFLDLCLGVAFFASFILMFIAPLAIAVLSMIDIGIASSNESVSIKKLLVCVGLICFSLMTMCGYIYSFFRFEQYMKSKYSK